MYRKAQLDDRLQSTVKKTIIQSALFLEMHKKADRNIEHSILIHEYRLDFFLTYFKFF